MPPVGFEPTISAGEQPQTYVLNRVATGTGIYHIISYIKIAYPCARVKPQNCYEVSIYE